MDDERAIRAARRALEDGSPSDALETLWEVLGRARLSEHAGHLALETMARALSMLGRTRAQASIVAYLGAPAAAAELVPESPRDRARYARLAGDAGAAAPLYAEAGYPVHAAFAEEASGRPDAARARWERLVADPTVARDAYVLGLVHVNRARTLRAAGDAREGRRAEVAAMLALEAAADGFEHARRRERAFDCYQALLELGRADAFENLAEGYLNCIRVLCADGLRTYALRYYQDFQEQALARGELEAAATLFAEAADYAQREALPYGPHFRLRAADAWTQAGEAALARGEPAELVENTWAAAVEALVAAGQLARARRLYDRLGELPLAEGRRGRYRRLAERIGDEPSTAQDPIPPPPRPTEGSAYVETWRADLVEWEQAGDAAEALGDIAYDAAWPETTRRRALLVRVRQLASEGPPWSDPVAVRLAEELGRTELYVALGPLERLAEHPRAGVRVAVQEAARHLLFKRTVGLVERGLADRAESVRAAAIASLPALHFEHALDPLSRIFRGAREGAVRLAVMRALSRVPSAAAAELLIEIARSGSPAERKSATGFLRDLEAPGLDGLLRAAADEETGALRRALEDALLARAER